MVGGQGVESPLCHLNAGSLSARFEDDVDPEPLGLGEVTPAALELDPRVDGSSEADAQEAGEPSNREEPPAAA